MTYEAAEKACISNNFKLLIIEYQSVEESFNTFYETTFELNLWINGRQDANGLWYINEKESSSMNKKLSNKSSTEKSPCLAIANINGSASLLLSKCSEKYFAVCGFSDGTEINPPDYKGCATFSEIYDTKTFLKTVCFSGKKMRRLSAKSACQSNNMTLLTINDGKLEESFGEIAKSHLENGASFWVDNGKNYSCLAEKLEGNSLSLVSASCDLKLWTYCETRERKPEHHYQCKNEKVYKYYKQSVTACTIYPHNSYDEASEACKDLNMTLLTASTEAVKEVMFKYAIEISRKGGAEFWQNGRKVGTSQLWYASDSEPLFKGLYPNDTDVTKKCLSIVTSNTSQVFSEGRVCSERYSSFCGKTRFLNAPKIECVRKKDIFDTAKVYIKSVCEVQYAASYFDANQMCQSIGMELFTIDSSDVLSTLFIYASKTGKSLWINGRRDGFGPWFSYNPEKNPIFPGLSWSAKRTPASCLSVTKVEKNMESTATKCETTLDFYCEYKKA